MLNLIEFEPGADGAAAQPSARAARDRAARHAGARRGRGRARAGADGGVCAARRRRALRVLRARRARSCWTSSSPCGRTTASAGSRLRAKVGLCSADYTLGRTRSSFNFMRDVVEPLAADRNRRARHVRRSHRPRRARSRSPSWRSTPPAGPAAAVAGLRAGRPRARPARQGAGLARSHARLDQGGPRQRALLRRCCERRDLAFRARHSGARLIVADRSSQVEVDAMRALLDDPIDVLYLDEAQLLLRRQPADCGHGGDALVRRGVHPLHVRYDEGAEGSHARARLRVREAPAG